MIFLIFRITVNILSKYINTNTFFKLKKYKQNKDIYNIGKFLFRNN